MSRTTSRRTVLRWMGLQLSLPLVSGLVSDRARAQQGPRKHFIFFEPGGIRIEFIWPGV